MRGRARTGVVVAVGVAVVGSYVLSAAGGDFLTAAVWLTGIAAWLAFAAARAPWTSERRRGRALAAWVLATLVVGLAVFSWFAIAVIADALGCGENCDAAAEATRWQYDGQFLIALAGVIACATGLTLGFTRHRRLSWATLATTALLAAAWAAVVGSL